jgi:hypothetical protein
MERARELRENAARYLRLSMNVNAAADVTWLEDLAAEATQGAERIEAEEAAGAACAGVAEGSDALTNRDAETEPDTLTDRRRAGRRDDISPALISLLREDSITSVPGEPVIGGHDDLSASRGIIIWALTATAIWLSLVSWIVGHGR